jgi:hypothetical protein
MHTSVSGELLLVGHFCDWVTSSSGSLLWEPPALQFVPVMAHPFLVFNVTQWTLLASLRKVIKHLSIWNTTNGLFISLHLLFDSPIVWRLVDERLIHIRPFKNQLCFVRATSSAKFTCPYLGISRGRIKKFKKARWRPPALRRSWMYGAGEPHTSSYWIISPAMPFWVPAGRTRHHKTTWATLVQYYFYIR